MRTKISKKIKIVFFLLFILIGLLFVYFSLKKQEIFADVVTPENVKTVDVSKPEIDKRTEISVPILMYHHIRSYENSEDQIGTNLSVSEENFKAQINLLKEQGYETITLDIFSQFPQKILPEKPIILTFDDGYDDSYFAYKILKENNMTGTFFIISNFIGRAGHLNLEQIEEMSNNDMEIGSHTLNHLNLANISYKKLISELEESKLKLEDITGKPINTLCYPAGKYNDQVTKTASDSGYRIAVTTKEGIANSNDDKLTLKRFRIYHNQTLKSFSEKINLN